MPDLEQPLLARSSLRHAACPAAVVAVTVPKGTVPLLGACLMALARSRGLAGLRVSPGALAVLILAEEEEARAVAEDLALA